MPRRPWEYTPHTRQEQAKQARDREAARLSDRRDPQRQTLAAMLDMLSLGHYAPMLISPNPDDHTTPRTNPNGTSPNTAASPSHGPMGARPPSSRGSSSPQPPIGRPSTAGTSGASQRSPVMAHRPHSSPGMRTPRSPTESVLSGVAEIYDDGLPGQPIVKSSPLPDAAIGQAQESDAAAVTEAPTPVGSLLSGRRGLSSGSLREGSPGGSARDLRQRPSPRQEQQLQQQQRGYERGAGQQSTEPWPASSRKKKQRPDHGPFASIEELAADPPRWRAIVTRRDHRAMLDAYLYHRKRQPVDEAQTAERRLRAFRIVREALADIRGLQEEHASLLRRHAAEEREEREAETKQVERVSAKTKVSFVRHRMHGGRTSTRRATNGPAPAAGAPVSPEKSTSGEPSMKPQDGADNDAPLGGENEGEKKSGGSGAKTEEPDPRMAHPSSGARRRMNAQDRMLTAIDDAKDRLLAAQRELGMTPTEFAAPLRKSKRPPTPTQGRRKEPQPKPNSDARAIPRESTTVPAAAFSAQGHAFTAKREPHNEARHQQEPHSEADEHVLDAASPDVEQAPGDDTASGPSRKEETPTPRVRPMSSSGRRSSPPRRPGSALSGSRGPSASAAQPHEGFPRSHQSQPGPRSFPHRQQRPWRRPVAALHVLTDAPELERAFCAGVAGVALSEDPRQQSEGSAAYNDNRPQSACKRRHQPPRPGVYHSVDSAAFQCHSSQSHFDGSPGLAATAPVRPSSSSSMLPEHTEVLSGSAGRFSHRQLKRQMDEEFQQRCACSDNDEPDRRGQDCDMPLAAESEAPDQPDGACPDDSRAGADEPSANDAAEAGKTLDEGPDATGSEEHRESPDVTSPEQNTQQPADSSPTIPTDTTEAAAEQEPTPEAEESTPAEDEPVPDAAVTVNPPTPQPSEIPTTTGINAAAHRPVRPISSLSGNPGGHGGAVPPVYRLDLESGVPCTMPADPSPRDANGGGVSAAGSRLYQRSHPQQGATHSGVAPKQREANRERQRPGSGAAAAGVAQQPPRPSSSFASVPRQSQNTRAGGQAQVQPQGRPHSAAGFTAGPSPGGAGWTAPLAGTTDRRRRLQFAQQMRSLTAEQSDTLRRAATMQRVDAAAELAVRATQNSAMRWGRRVRPDDDGSMNVDAVRSGDPSLSPRRMTVEGAAPTQQSFSYAPRGPVTAAAAVARKAAMDADAMSFVARGAAAVSSQARPLSAAAIAAEYAHKAEQDRR